MKTGRLSKEEQQTIMEFHLIHTVEELAERLDRRVEPIIKFLEEHAPKVREEDEEDRELLNVLHGKVYWRGIGEQFTKKEVEDFEKYWVELLKDFNKDVTFSEEMQMVDLVKIKLLIDRNLYERSKSRVELDKIQRILDDFHDKNGMPPFDNHGLGVQEQLLVQQVRLCEGSYTGRTSEYNTLISKQQAFFDELKATRKGRIEVLKNSKKDWVHLMRSLSDEKIREREGREVALINLATEKEKDKLTSYHIYSDGVADIPLLNSESIEKIDKGKEDGD